MARRWWPLAAGAVWVIGAAVAMPAGRAAGDEVTPSFDCHKATQWSEMMVCGNPDLAAMDAKVDRAYRRTERSLPPEQAAEVREVQAAWIRGREKCQQDPDPIKCLQDYYQRRIKEIVQPEDGGE